MWKPVLMASLIFASGILVQTKTGLLDRYFNSNIQVYADPNWYIVTRVNATINYKAKGQRLVECTHKAPLLADIFDKYGNLLSRELVRKSVTRKPNRVAEVVDDGTIIGTLRVAPEPREFYADSYIIVTDIKTLETASEFVIRSECFNSVDGRFSGSFGPFPIPADGESASSFSVTSQ